MDTFAQAVAEFQGAEAAGFNFKPERAAELLNEGVRRFAARSEWIKAEIGLGVTVVGQEGYPLPVNVVKLRGLSVAGVAYTAVDALTIWQYKMRGGLPPGVDGAYAERFNEDGKIKSFSILPAPEQAGLEIDGLAVIVPAVDLSGNDALPFPEEYNRGPLNYAVAVAYEQVDENAAAGAEFREKAEGEADELRLRAQSRTGAGPYRIPVATARRGRRWR